ncbi:hypothetical protein HYS00_04495 [Candidatus Microgenomates bacterium]|nr:hypothetical protein [Candidatus Microgenomates bacterium]
MVVLIGSVLSGSGLLSFVNFAQFNPSQKQGQLDEFSNEDGYIELKPTGNKKVFTQGTNETIDVNISLRDKEIAGYTVPISYDDTKYSFVGIENSDTRFNLYSRNEGNSYLILVGIQQPNNTDKITLYKATVARLIFKPRGGGRSDISVKDKTPKGYTLKLINEKNDALVPSFGTLQVTAK